jgi:hypothetical protein
MVYLQTHNSFNSSQINIKLFENFINNNNIKSGDKISMKKITQFKKSDVTESDKEYIGILKDDIEKGKSIYLLDDKGNIILNTSPIIGIHKNKNLVKTETSIYEISMKDNKKNKKPKPFKLGTLKGLDVFIEPILVDKINISSDANPYRYKLTLDARGLILLNINGLRIPFYKSSGLARKKNVKSGVWYNIWGIKEKRGPDGSIHGVKWFNKGTERDINNFYNIELFRIISNKLNDTNLDSLDKDATTLYSLSEEGLNQINTDMNPKTNKDFDWGHIEKVKQKLLNILPNELKGLVKMGCPDKYPSDNIIYD